VAADGKMGIMVGGPKETFHTCVLIFEKMSARILYGGGNGMGTTLKLINNIILGEGKPFLRVSLSPDDSAGLDQGGA